MRVLLPLLLTASCATHDVLHSEPVAARAVCDGGLGVFGYPGDVADCTDRVTSLGDGCYVARRGTELHVVQCEAKAPDGHVMCGDDSLGAQPPAFEGESTVQGVWFVLPSITHITKAGILTFGRCRQRFESWAAQQPPRTTPPALLVTWRAIDGKRYPEDGGTTFVPDEDRYELHRILRFGMTRARACESPGGVHVTLEEDLPARFAHRLIGAVEPALAKHRMYGCSQILLSLTMAPLRPQVAARPEPKR